MLDRNVLDNKGLSTILNRRVLGAVKFVVQLGMVARVQISMENRKK